MKYCDDKVCLKKIKVKDTENIVKWRNSENVKQYLFTKDNITAKQHIEWIESNVKTKKCFQFIILINKTNIPIGSTFIKNIDWDKHKGEFGIFIGEDSARNLGYGTSATRLILNFAFEELKLDKVYLKVFKDNARAIKSYKKAGFSAEKIKTNNTKIKEKLSKIILMTISKSEWLKLSGKST